MTFLIALALLIVLIALNWVVWKRSGGLVNFLWILGGFYLMSLIYSATILDALASELTFRAWRGESVSEALGLPSAPLNWLFWLNWLAILVLVTSFFRLHRAADAARGAADLLSYDKKNADAESRHTHAALIGYIPQGVVFFILSHFLFPGYY